jgi:prephenate dehydrogenase
MTKSPPRACVVGVGLMGGSLGLALRRRGWRVTGVGRNPARLRRALRCGAVDDVSVDLETGVRGAEAIILAVPVGDIISFGRKVRPVVSPAAFVTDVGSVKGAIARAFADWPQFVGAHPMCGSEKTGVAHADPDLYRGATCLLTPTARTSPKAVSAAKRLWTSVGARVVPLSPEDHDVRVALVSHLPHLLAEALVSTLPKGASWVPRVAAGSFRDATRVAASDPVLWSQIFAMNRAAVRRAAADFQRALTTLVRKGPDEKTLRDVVRRHASFLRTSS